MTSTVISPEQNEPNLIWESQPKVAGDRSVVDAIRYNSDQYEFVGRRAELDLLGQFLGDITIAGPRSAFQWLLITGPGGEGKSRLAFHFIQNVVPQPWKAGRLYFTDLRDLNFSKWRPRQPTLLVIDYPAQEPDLVRDLLTNLQRNAILFDFPARVLLLEREATGEWFNKVFPENSTSAWFVAIAFAARNSKKAGHCRRPRPPISKPLCATGSTRPNSNRQPIRCFSRRRSRLIRAPLKMTMEILSGVPAPCLPPRRRRFWCWTPGRVKLITPHWSRHWSARKFWPA